jgi:hypothetical protein
VGTIRAAVLLGRVLRAAGISTICGEAIPGLDVVGVRDPAVAGLLARAHARVLGLGAVHHRGGVLAGTGGDLLDVDHPADLVAAVPWLAAGNGVRLLFDLDEPAADIAPEAPVRDRWLDPGDEVVDALLAASDPIVLAGPGVVASGCVPGLHALAAAGSLGVLNTWGAKGVFDWRSQHHLATAGLQARDFELGGISDADLVVATGIDPLEAPARLWRDGGRSVVEVAPAALDPLAERWSRPGRPIEVPPLRAGLAAVTQEGWASTSTPLPPTRITRNYGLVGSAGGLVAADPGTAGYWVARTFATTELGGVIVPAERDASGFAVACCIAARLADPGRAVLAAVDDAPLELLEVAASLGVAVPVEVWTPDGETIDAGEHARRLRSAVVARHSSVVTVATDPTQLDRMIEVAGPVVAWSR